MERLLVVDDEPILLKGLKFSLEQEEYEIETAIDGEEAINKFQSGEYDLIILDIMLPKINGIEVCRKIREVSNIPIIMLTAKGDDDSKIDGLEVGADDYLTKPFNILELKARIKAVLRRFNVGDIHKAPEIKIGDFVINTLGHKLTIKGEDINLTAKEFDLLLLLIINQNKVFSREKLLEIIWDYEYFGDVRTVDVHVRRLREKIEIDSSHPEYILTKWGVGYYFRHQ